MEQPLVKICTSCNRAVGYKKDNYICDECRELAKTVHKYKKVEEGENKCKVCNGKQFRELRHPKESNSMVVIECIYCQPIPF